MAVKIDIIDGSRGKMDKDGWSEVQRVAIVTGVTGEGQEQLVNAIGASGMPELGDAHPDPTLADLHLTEIQPQALGPGNVKAILSYTREEPDESGSGGVITVGTTLQQVETNVDAYGKPLLVTYNGNEQVGTASVLTPQTTLHAERTEHQSPAAASMAYVGRVNAGPWDIIDPGAAGRIWLCSGIVGTSRDGARTYLTSYDFIRAPKTADNQETTWDAFVYYKDPATGKPPPDVHDIDYTANSGLGWRRFEVYPAIDFTPLGLGRKGG